MSARKTDWIVAGGTVGEVGYCTRCGGGLSLPMPIDLNVFSGALEGFIKSHSGCQESGYRPPAINRHNWVASRDTGTSSLTIWSVMTGMPSPHESYDAPHDPADFGRCYRLLRLFPEWRAHLVGKVAERCPQWKGIAAHWDELAALYEEEINSGKAPRLYARIQELRK